MKKTILNKRKNIKCIFPFHEVTEEKMPAQVNGNRFICTGFFDLSHPVSNFWFLCHTFWNNFDDIQDCPIKIMWN